MTYLRIKGRYFVLAAAFAVATLAVPSTGSARIGAKCRVCEGSNCKVAWDGWTYCNGAAGGGCDVAEFCSSWGWAPSISF